MCDQVRCNECDWDSPRCGMPNKIPPTLSRAEFAAYGISMPDVVGDDPNRWVKKPVTWGVPRDMRNRDKWRQALVGAATLWSSVSGLQISEVAPDLPNEPPDILARLITLDGPYGRLAQAWLPGGGYGPASVELWGNIDLDREEPWGSVFSREHVVIHEKGHALGLDHAEDPDNMMYPMYQDRLTLGTWDIAEIQRRYGLPMAESGDKQIIEAALIFGNIQQSILLRRQVPQTTKDAAMYLLRASQGR